MIEALPGIASAVAEPLKNTEKMVFISGGGSGGGPSQFTKEMNRMMAEVPETVSALTGYDLNKGIASLLTGQSGQSMINGAMEGTFSALAEKALETK